MKFSVPSQVTSVKPLKDRSWSITLHTKELSSEEYKYIVDALQFEDEGWFIYSPNEIKEEELPKEDAEFESKTPSQRLRGVLYRVLEQELGSKPSEENWRRYYNQSMEKIINKLKDRLV